MSAGDINNDGLIDLFFTGNMVQNKLYLNKGNLKFEDITETAAVSGDSRWYTGVTMADINADGLLDIYCSDGSKFGPKENQLFINKGNNGDGNLDIVVMANLYSSEVETPRNDASNGLLLKGNGARGFKATRALESGLYAPGDVKDMAKIIVNGKEHLLLSKNSDYLQLIKVNKSK